MNSVIKKVVVETTVRNTLRDIKSAPGRTTRKLVDMACKLSNGRFQKIFFGIARQMLEDEDNEYYNLIQDAIYHVDLERMVQFGMRVGYNGCTVGAEQIRMLEREKDVNIPWSYIYEIDGGAFEKYAELYDQKMTEGQDLGTYLYQIRISGDAAQIFPLIEKHDSCAFALYCTPEQVTQEVVEEVDKNRNTCIGVIMTRDTDLDMLGRVCQNMRSCQLLYGILYEYEDTDVERIISGDVAEEMVEYHPASILYRRKPGVSDERMNQMYAYVLRERNNPHYPVIPMEYDGDNVFVNSVISEHSQMGWLTEEGELHYFNGERTSGLDALNRPLLDVLKEHTKLEERVDVLQKQKAN